MSRGTSPDNPIVIFGNIGPDVVKVSQIYDPDNDQYVLSQDVIAQTGKEYFTRTYANRTITFTPVTGVVTSKNPSEEGWYEVNYAHQDQTGKYVPAPKSLVVCDVAYENFKARSVLIVESVDDQGENPTFKSTLVPSTNGQDSEESPRIVDYGNDRFMLYMERDDEFTRVCPDRKLMLYGHRIYAYLLRKNGRSIAVPARELIGVTNDALVPYSGETTSGVDLTATNIEGYEGQLFSVLIRNNYRTVAIPDISSSSVCCKTLDEYYIRDKDYYLEEYNAQGERTFRLLTQGTDYHVGDLVGELRTEDDPGYSRIYVTGEQFLFGVVKYTGWLTINDHPEGSIRYPERCWLKSGESLSSGEEVTMEVYEYEGESYRMVLSLTLIAKAGSTLEPTNKITKQLDSFKVTVENADMDEHGVALLQVGETTKNWIFHPTLVFNDGSETIVPIDNTQSFMYGLENVRSTNEGQEFRLLFKYFPTKESPIHENMTKNFVDTTLTVRVVNGSSATIRKISVLPLWNYTANKYEFVFLPYNASWTEPEVIKEGGFFGNSTVLAFNLASYMDPNGNVRALDASLLGENVGVYQHGRLAVTTTVPGYKTDVYQQNVAMRLQPWTTNSIAVKWLLGSYLTVSDGSTIEEYSADEVPYGSATVGMRPYLECARATRGYTLSIPTKFAAKADFMRYFFTLGYKEPSEIEPSTVDYTPNRFRIRSLATVNTYDSLDPAVNPYAMEGVRYFKSNGEEVEVVVGRTPVSRYYVHVQEELRYFTKENDLYVEVTDLTIGATLTIEQRESFYIQRDTPVTTAWKEIPTAFDGSNRSFVLGVGNDPIEGSDFYPTNMLGGPIPTVVGESYNTQVMGVVVVEFGYIDNDSVDYKWIYGVPAEVMFPYKPTVDTEYQQGKSYYLYDSNNNAFSQEPTPQVGEPIPSSPQRYEAI